MLFFQKKPELIFTISALHGLHRWLKTHHGSEDEYIQLLDKKTGIERVLQGLVVFRDRKCSENIFRHKWGQGGRDSGEVTNWIGIS